MIAAIELTPAVMGLAGGAALGLLALGVGVGLLLRPRQQAAAAAQQALRAANGRAANGRAANGRAANGRAANGRAANGRAAEGEDGAAATTGSGRQGWARARGRAASGRGSHQPSVGERSSHPHVRGTPSADFDTWKDRKLSEELKDENTELRNLFTLLPGLTRRITETLKPEEITATLADMVTRICLPPPDRVLVFLCDGDGAFLTLAAVLGHFEIQVNPGLVVEVSGGLLAACVQRRVTVDERAFLADPVGGKTLDAGAYPFPVEIAAPMIHHRRLRGVIAVAGLPPQNRFAKRMVTVAANLGGLALENADNVRQIQHLADCDALTGLFNKRYFFERLQEVEEEARANSTGFSLFMFDIDHFKKYNDRNGHQAGDEALRLTGRLLREMSAQDGWVAARYGGEEFVVLMPGLEKSAARAFGDRFRLAVTEGQYTYGDTQPMGLVTISGGVAAFPEDATNGGAVIERADAELYKAKNAGRNQILG